VRRFALSFLLAVTAIAGDKWTEYRSGPFHIFSDTGDKPARERLALLEQMRHVIGSVIKAPPGSAPGKLGEVDPVWPIHLFLFANQREYGPHALPRPLVVGGSATLSAWIADTPQPRDFLRELALLLIRDGTGRMPETTEIALGDLFSTLKVNATHVTLGLPLAAVELPPERMRAWAKVQMLATLGEYSGKFRVYLANLAAGVDEPSAVRNAFDITLAELDKRVVAYQAAGKFEGVPVSGLALDPSKDFIEKTVDPDAVAAMLAELVGQGKTFPPDSPRGLVAKNTRPALELAMKANPRWGEPYFRMAALETNPLAKVAALKKAATLEPRNAAYWRALAEAQMAAEQFADSAKSWAAAERAASTPEERERIHQARLDVEDRRAEAEAAEKKRKADEAARELQRIKDSAAAEVHAAEDAANKRLGSNPDAAKNAIAWWDDPTGTPVEGMLTRVDCLNGPLRLTVQSHGAAIKILIRDLNKITVHGAAEAQFACGVQRTARKIRLVHNAKPDAKLGTAGDLLVVEFP
jgi:hypothetical protein